MHQFQQRHRISFWLSLYLISLELSISWMSSDCTGAIELYLPGLRNSINFINIIKGHQFHKMSPCVTRISSVASSSSRYVKNISKTHHHCYQLRHFVTMLSILTCCIRFIKKTSISLVSLVSWISEFIVYVNSFISLCRAHQVPSLHQFHRFWSAAAVPSNFESFMNSLIHIVSFAEFINFIHFTILIIFINFTTLIIFIIFIIFITLLLLSASERS